LVNIGWNLPRLKPKSGSNKHSFRVCVVTGEIGGPDFNGGIGTANLGLALALRHAGFTVDVLYTRVDEGRPHAFRGDFADQVSAFAARGISLFCIDHDGPWNNYAGKSRAALAHLAEHPYDFAFFNDCHGNAYYPLIAKRTGHPGLRDTTMCVVTHSATQWIYEINEQPVATVEEARQIEIEKRSVELADVVISPSRYLLDKYKSYGWKLPKRTYVQPNILPQRSRALDEIDVVKHKVDELVFFGRLEARKGLWVFAAALEDLKYEFPHLKVSFLGKFVDSDGVSSGLELQRRTLAWPCPVRYLHNYDQEQALRYLAVPGRLAVMPSLADNSPCVIFECLNEGVSFIAASGSGGQELIASECWSDVLFEPTARKLADKLRTVLRTGTRTALPSFDPYANEQQIVDWVAATIEAERSRKSAAVEPKDRARVLILAFQPHGMSATDAARAISELPVLSEKEEIVTVSGDPETLYQAIADQDRSIEVVHGRDFAAWTRHFDRAGWDCIIAAELGMSFDKTLVERSLLAFRTTPSLAAVVPMVADPARRSDDVQRPTYMLKSLHMPNTRKLLVGPAESLFLLNVSTNDGIALLRPDALDMLATADPWDPTYSALMEIDGLLHLALIELKLSGREFEVLPDVTVVRSPDVGGLEVFRLIDRIRALVRHRIAGEAGTPRASVYRLAIDGAFRDERAAVSAKALAPLCRTLSMDRKQLMTGADSIKTLELLIAGAAAVGRPELSLRFASDCIKASYPESSKDLATPGALLDTMRIKRSLLELAKMQAFTRINLDDPWSYKLLVNESELEIHANRSDQGVAAIEFPNVSLRGCESLNVRVRLPSSDAVPVVCRMRVVNGDRSIVLESEANLNAGGEQMISLAFDTEPPDHGDIVLSVQLGDGYETPNNAWTRWCEPTLTYRQG
jgi:glycosyltransferase involved in cell wall biosynthesis